MKQTQNKILRDSLLTLQPLVSPPKDPKHGGIEAAEHGNGARSRPRINGYALGAAMLASTTSILLGYGEKGKTFLFIQFDVGIGSSPCSVL